MISEKVVFVLGAGSNLEHGFLLGKDLKSKIAERLGQKLTNGGRTKHLTDFMRAVYQSKGWAEAKLERSACPAAAGKIVRGLNGKDSIDEFLDVHSHDKAVNLLGKLSILDTVLASERFSGLAYDNHHANVPEIELKDGAYSLLWRNLSRNIRAADIKELGDRYKSRVSFITFNYDRSLEQFMFRALAQTYDLDSNTAAQIVRGMNIHHVYGAIADWGYGIHDPHESAVPFGYPGELFNSFKFPGELIHAMAANISTYTEQIADEKVRLFQEIIGQAHQVYFLGMGYHEQNMKLLVPKTKMVAAIIAGTAVREPERKCERLSDLFRSRSNSLTNGASIIISERTCEQLFADFSTDMQSYSF